MEENQSQWQHVLLSGNETKQFNHKRKSSMKMNQLLVTSGIAAALFLSAGNVSAQDDNAGPGGGPGGGFRNMDPAQRQQFFMNNIREQLGFTNDTDWNAVQPLVQKVMDARRDVGFGGGMGRMFRGNRGGGPGGDQAGGNGGRRGFFGGTPSPEAEALQKAIDDNAPTAQVKEALATYRATQKAKQARLEQSQADLRKVLSIKQEAQATLLGLLS